MTWKCWRLWYQGPPGARCLYFYRSDPADPRSHRYERPHMPLCRVIDGGLLIGTQRYHAYWRWRWPRVGEGS